MFCSKCGNKLGDSDNFCCKCGTRRAYPSNDEHNANTSHVIDQTIHFSNGKLFKIVSGDPNYWYNARYLVSDGVTYDLNNPSDIKQIRTPNFQPDTSMQGYGITGSLDYVLRMKAGACFNNGQKELCSALLWKSTELMHANKWCAWQKKDFERLINWHYDLGMPGEAEKAKKYLMSFDLFQKNQFDILAEQIKISVLSDCKQLGIDLVVFHDHFGDTCGECAKMNARVYSISGKSRLYPKLPDYVREHGNFHPGCRCTMSVYFGEPVYYRGKETNARWASNRSYTDDRTEVQKAMYQEYLDHLADEAQKEADRNEYQLILTKLPDIAPKSFASYRRMKNAKTKNFFSIVEIAKKHNINIDLE